MAFRPRRPRRAGPILAAALGVVAMGVVAMGCADTRPPDEADQDNATDPTQATTDRAPAGSDSGSDTGSDSDSERAVVGGEARVFGPAPTAPDGPWSDETMADLDLIVATLISGLVPRAQLDDITATGDPRLAWAMADLLRFIGPGEAGEHIIETTRRLTPELDIDPAAPWGSTVDQMMAWDLPAPAQYADFKRNFYGQIEPRWGELFTNADIDWRMVGWGGVGIDDREFGSTAPCRCIPALDNPDVTPATEGDWYPDDAIVFGVVVADEARAYPKNIMEVHEMVNDTLGGRDLAVPYCTLCGSAQAFLTDELPPDLNEEHGRPVLRTSGLLFRSNKMMFERRSRSLVDTFTGRATSGPLAEAGVVFDQVSVVTTTWEQWRAAHPETTIVAEDGGIGRSYELDPLRGRDDEGPIFPIGEVDPRLPVQEPVLGLITDDGRPLAVHVGAAIDALGGGQGRVEVEGFELRLDGGGLRAVRAATDGDADTEAGAHQAFWFAWSQFHPDTMVWPLDYP